MPGPGYYDPDYYPGGWVPPVSGNSGQRQLPWSGRSQESGFARHPSHRHHGGSHGTGLNQPTGTTHQGNYSGNYSGNSRIVTVVIENTKEKIIPAIRYFREVGVYTEESYNRLLKRLAKACGVPTYKKNFPVVEVDDGYSSLTNSKVKRKGIYEGDHREKLIRMKRLADVQTFLCLWYIYLTHRNSRFLSPRTEKVGGAHSPESVYAQEVMEKSEPRQVRNWKQRAFVEETEL